MQLSVKPKADLSHNPFDTASRDVFSLKTGMITPCLVRHTLPDSMYDCKVTGITRTIPVQSSPFTRMSQNFEYYFVPYSQIFMDFERIYYERGDDQRNIANNPSGYPLHATQLPCFSLKGVLSGLWRNYVIERLKLSMRLANDSGAFSSGNWSLWRGAIENIYSNEYQDVHGRTCAEDQLRIFDMLGYGNYLSVFKFIYARIFNNYETLWKAQSSSLPQEIVTFFDALDGDFASFQGVQDIDLVIADFVQNAFWNMFYNNLQDQKPNIFALAAYVKVWSDFYRNSTYDINIAYSRFFNFDYIVDDSSVVVGTDVILRMLVPRYRQYKKDMFTGGYPSAQFGSVAVANLENPSQIFNTVSSPAQQSNLVLSSNSGSYAGKRPVGVSGNFDSSAKSWIIESSVSALSVRQALAMQRYKERILRAGNRQRALQSAVFGDKSRYVEDHYVDFLGSQQSIINFNSVAATTSNDDVALGELGSNGVSSFDDHVFKYHSHDFGIIIGVTYILPESEYEAYMIDYFNTTSESYDFYKPDFMNLGLQEVFNFHFNNIPSPFNNDPYSVDVLNFLSRYWPYKVAVDKVHGEFYSSLPFKYPDVDNPVSGLDFVSVGAFADYVTPRKSNSLKQLVLPSLYVNPTDVDRIFYQVSDETQASDQFKCAVLHDFKSVLPMSVVGLPSL